MWGGEDNVSNIQEQTTATAALMSKVDGCCRVNDGDGVTVRIKRRVNWLVCGHQLTLGGNGNYESYNGESCSHWP